MSCMFSSKGTALALMTKEDSQGNLDIQIQTAEGKGREWRPHLSELVRENAT